MNLIHQKIRRKKGDPQIRVVIIAIITATTTTIIAIIMVIITTNIIIIHQELKVEFLPKQFLNGNRNDQEREYNIILYTGILYVI